MKKQHGQPNHILKQQLEVANQLIKQNRSADAIDLLKGLATQFPAVLPITHNIGALCEREGDYQQAAHYFQQTLNKLKKHPQRKQLVNDEITFTNSLAGALSKSGQLEKAAKYFEASLKLDATQMKISEQYALLIAPSKKPKAMKPYLEKQVASFPSSKTLKNLLAKTLLALGEHELGLRYQQQATGFVQLQAGKVSLIQ